MSDTNDESNMMSELRTRPSGSQTELHTASRGPVILSHDSSALGSSSDLELENTNDLVEKVRSLLSCDLLACDVQVSLFVATCQSYRQDTALRPFPPMFLTETGDRDIPALLSAVNRLPPLADLLRQLDAGPGAAEDKRVLALLAWVLTGGPSKLNMRTLTQAQARETIKLAEGHISSKYPQPSYVLEVKTNVTERWREDDTFWAFHGSRLDNFHSILSHGLQQHRTQNSLFGEGIYLSSDLGVCLAYSSRGEGWKHSAIGPSLSCIALAQVKHHPSVKIHTKDPGRGVVEGSEGGRVPEKYVVVRNNDLVHIRYLLVYRHQPPATGGSSNIVTTWMANNKMLLLLLGYAVLLLAIGLSNSITLRRWLRRGGWID